MSGMRISQLAERSGVPATTLQYYESAGLLAADRTPAGYRVYNDAAVERLAFIRAAKQVGLPLDEIRELLQVWHHGACIDARQQMRPMMSARLEDVTARIADLQRFAESLQSALSRLDALPDRNTPCDARCTFLQSSEPSLIPDVPGLPR